MQGLGDLAAHLVAFHNMGASPSHDPFVSGVKVDFNPDSQERGNADHSPHAHSQTHNAASLVDQDHAFDGSDQVCVSVQYVRSGTCFLDGILLWCKRRYLCKPIKQAQVLALQGTPLSLAEGEGEMFAEIDQMINVHEDAMEEAEAHNDLVDGS
jgi:hypothetical protein